MFITNTNKITNKTFKDFPKILRILCSDFLTKSYIVK